LKLFHYRRHFYRVGSGAKNGENLSAGHAASFYRTKEELHKQAGVSAARRNYRPVAQADFPP
jgi:hypothetical protein